MRNKLTAVQIKRAPDGKMFDGGGLTLIKSGEAGKWVYRYSHLGRRREMGLGTWPTVSLADARKARDAWAVELAAGRDPIAVRDADAAAQIAHRDRDDPTFSELLDKVFDARKAGLRGEGKRGRWRSPVDLHLLPAIGTKRGSAITPQDVADALRPIWRTKHPTAVKAWERSRIVLREAQLMGFPVNPFTADAARRILGDVRHDVTPTPSTPWQDMPALYARLPDGATGDCLRLMMLTVVRMDGCRGARQGELDGATWTVPADRVKGKEGKVADFRVPLSVPAQGIFARAARYSDGLLFPSWTGRAVTSAALEKVLIGLKEPGRPHGFRASFRSWVQDTDACPWEVAETILGHVIGNRVERSYARSDLLERRRPVMEAWANYLTKEPPA